MGDDVICIDSDEDDEDETGGRSGGSALNARGPPQAGWRRGWRQRRRAQRGRKNDSGVPSAAPLTKLLDGLRWLSSEMYFGSWAGKSGPDFPFHLLAQRVRSLVGEFQRFGTARTLTMAERTEGWRQVVRFLVLLRTIGLTEGPFPDDVDPGCDKHLRGDDKQSIEDVCRERANLKLTQHPGSGPSGRERARQTRRYQLTVIDILADYIRFRCESVAGLHPPILPGPLLAECNRIVSSLFVIFDGSVELVTLTLLRLLPDRRHTLLLYPVFENVLTSVGCAEPADIARTIPCYVRLLLCFKRWKSLVGGRAEKRSIDAHAIQLLPGRCPTVRHASDLPFLRLLPPVPAAQRATETRYLLVNDLFDLEHCVGQFLRHYRRTGGHPVDESTAKQHDDSSFRQRRLHSMEIRSNYINVPLLAELIERKSQLWARAAFPAPPDTVDRCLRQEAHSIVESLRLIFRNRTECIELTLLRVKSCPSVASLLVPVFDAFLGPAAAASPAYGANAPAPATTTTGLTIYRSNDVETYGRLVLCYAKWKALLWTDGPDPAGEWARIDAVALTQLPYEFPRAICPRDAALRRIFPPASAVRPGVAPVDAKRSDTTTRILLRTLPKRADLQELCQKFIQAYGCGSDTNPPIHDQTPSPKTTPPAYKSTSAGPDRSLRHRQLDGVSVSVQPTIQPADSAECRSEMKPIIILDSDDVDEMANNNTTTSTISMAVRETDRNIPARHALLPLAVSSVPAGMETDHASELDRISPAAGTDEFVSDGTLVPLNVECFLNTPPATPQQQQQPHLQLELTPETVAQDELVKKSSSRGTGWLRLKGTIRLIARRKKRTRLAVAAATVRRALAKVLAGGDWWTFADVLAVKIRSPPGFGWYASIMHAGPARDRTLKAEQTFANEPPELSPVVGGRRRGAAAGADDRSTKNDALLRELIDCLGASVDAMPVGSTQGYVDFTILPDNPPGYGAERIASVDDQASPSRCGACVDTSPLFAADSDKYVLLFTELGPVSWPIV